MIGAHAAGVDHDYKKINKIHSICLVCGEPSECQILFYEKSFRVLMIKIETLEEHFIFDWEKCCHRAILDDPAHVARYKRDQEAMGYLTVPNYPNMRLHMTGTPRKVSTLEIVLVVAVVIALSSLLLVLHKVILDWLGISFIF